MIVEEWLGKDNTLGIDIWHRKYQKNNETFDDWLDRVSNHNEEVKRLIVEKKFLFGGRILSNRGVNDIKTTYSNCYVITPPEDNLESIYDCRKKLARTYSYGGGCGIDLSNLAPRGAKVNNQAEHTTGAVSFMEGFSQTTDEIGQNGRRGALMISLDCHHPDLEEFIDCKTKENAVTKANVSVRVTDDFMRAVENNENWTMRFVRPETNEVIERNANARGLFNKLCKNNWDWAEPGILFWDRITGYNLLSNNDEFEYAGVNPCAEEPLPAGGSCLLSSINLAEFVHNKEFDIADFRKTIRIAIRALNEVLDEGLLLHPLEEQRNSVNDWRQCGLGIMGLADMLIKMEVPYDSEEAIGLCDRIGLEMAKTAIEESSEIANERNCYPMYNDAIFNTDFFIVNSNKILEETIIRNGGLRNSQLLTIAPTGTISTMIGVSGGIEPIFANSYQRRTESLHGKSVTYKVYTPIVKEYMEKHGIAEEEDLPNWFVTSATINPMMRVKMQGIWQKHIDASISSTINLPNSATVEQVEELYLAAWKNGLKGMTIYRDGCKRSGILTTDNTEKHEEENGVLKRGDWKPLADDTVYYKKKLRIGCGDLKLFIGWSESEKCIQDLYVKKSGNGGCERLEESTAIAMSAILRLGGNICNIEKAFRGIGACPSFATARAKGRKLSNGSSCGTAILNAIKEFDVEMKKAPVVNKMQTTKNLNKCPECGSEIIQEGGCVVCKSCGWSKCD